MKYYLYFPETGIYNGAINLEENLKDPENATLLEPPEAAEGRVAVFADGEWSVMEDHRGTYWNIETKEQVDYIMPGPLPENLTALEPSSRDCKWTGDAWVIDMEKLKYDKKAEMADKRWQAETGGITINGVEIATDRESQALLMGAVLVAQNNPEYVVNWKAKNGWAVLDAATILAVADAVRNHVQACFDREKDLQDQIDAATTAAELEAVVW
jgi:hypothetical protein